MAPEPAGRSRASDLLQRAESAWASGDERGAMTVFDRAARTAEAEGDIDVQVDAVLGLARGQHYNLSPGVLPVRLHAAYAATHAPRHRVRLAAALARCWAYANEPRRAGPFAAEALTVADELGDPELAADALDAALASHWGPDDLDRRRTWALELGDTAAHLRDPDARLQAELWGLTVAWEVLDLPRMHRSMRAIELLAEESPRAGFFAATRRLPLEVLRGNTDAAPRLIAQAQESAATAVIPDAEPVLHGMRGYSAYFSGDADGCAVSAAVCERWADEYGIVALRAESAVLWLGAGRPDKVTEKVGAFTPAVLAGLPRDSDWLLTLQCVLEGAVAVEDREVAAAAVDLLTPYAGRSVVNAGAVMWHGVTDDTLARAHALLGHPEEASRHRVAALGTYDRIGARWWRERLRAQLPEPATRTPAADRVVHLQEQTGGLWLVGRPGETFVLPRMRGLDHLHRLLSRPGEDVSALDLAGGEAPITQPGLEVLDEEARRAYRARLVILDEELDGEPSVEGRDELRRERDAIAAELAGATGLGGRARRTGGHDERARVAVRKALVATLARIAEADPWLARHLHDHIRTGSVCRYDPDPDHPVTWVLTTKGHRDD
jgi:hypothetical protein